MAGTLAVPAAAQDGASASFAASTSEGVSADGSTGSARTSTPWSLARLQACLFPAKDHNFENAATEAGAHPHVKFKYPVVDLGLRVGYYPIQYLGLEVDGWLGFGETKLGGGATLGGFSGHLVGQVPLGPVTPFGLFGLGIMGAKTDTMGSDSDPENALRFRRENRFIRTSTCGRAPRLPRAAQPGGRRRPTNHWAGLVDITTCSD